MRCSKRNSFPFIYPQKLAINGQVAQSVEQGTENPRVGSSILSLATILFLLIIDLNI